MPSSAAVEWCRHIGNIDSVAEMLERRCFDATSVRGRRT